MSTMSCLIRKMPKYWESKHRRIIHGRRKKQEQKGCIKGDTMMIVPSKNPPPLERSRRHGEISFYEPELRSLPERWQPNNHIVKADQNSRKVYSALWLILIFGIWIAGIVYVISLFV